MNEAAVFELRTIALTLVQMHAANEIREAKYEAIRAAEVRKQRTTISNAADAVEALAPFVPKAARPVLVQLANAMRATLADEPQNEPPPAPDPAPEA